jgi:hypothetical protein
MIVHDPKELMLLKLTNPDDFAATKSYWNDDEWFQYEGHIKDIGQISGYSGERYGDDFYFIAHTVFSQSEICFRGQDRHVKDKMPWVAILSGDDSLYAVFCRFHTFVEMCEWLDNPNDKDVFYVY